jgi:hypothetical protein
LKSIQEAPADVLSLSAEESIQKEPSTPVNLPSSRFTGPALLRREVKVPAVKITHFSK